MINAATTNSKSINRRDFLKITAFAGLAAGLGISMGRKFLIGRDMHNVTETHYLMGTFVNFSLITPDMELGREAIYRTITEMKRLIGIFDYRLTGSPLAQLNHEGSLKDAPIELVEIMQQSFHLSVLSGGAFDVTVLPLLEVNKTGQNVTVDLLNLIDYRNVIVEGRQILFARPGMSVTLDGIAKGRVVDAGVAILRGMGFQNVLVEAGGDMMAGSAEFDATEWNIAISNPRPRGDSDFIARFSIRNKAVTTSGDYLNYYTMDYSRYHIIDPRKGSSPAELASATVIASNATEADALSTTLMVLGVQDGLEFVRELPDVEALLVTKDLIVHRSDGFPYNM